MLGRHVYRVHPVEAGWVVAKEGEDHPRGEYSERERAISDVRRAGTIENGDGTIANQWLFGADPIEKLQA